MIDSWISKRELTDYAEFWTSLVYKLKNLETESVLSQTERYFRQPFSSLLCKFNYWRINAVMSQSEKNCIIVYMSIYKDYILSKVYWSPQYCDRFLGCAIKPHYWRWLEIPITSQEKNPFFSSISSFEHSDIWTCLYWIWHFFQFFKNYFALDNNTQVFFNS